jgi:hypothetical protein
MRARLALAQLLEQTRRVDEAVDHYLELLRMNRNDNQGARYLLITLLLNSGEMKTRAACSLSTKTTCRRPGRIRGRSGRAGHKETAMRRVRRCGKPLGRTGT